MDGLEAHLGERPAWPSQFTNLETEANSFPNASGKCEGSPASSSNLL
jgi:hypothetical protein